MRIIGIDPGLKATGYGVVEYETAAPTLIETGTIQPRVRKDMPERLNSIYTTLGSLLDQYRPDVLVLEKLYAHYKHPITASIMGHARGIVCVLCAQKKINLSEQSVKRVRQALTGNGNASKFQVKRFVAYTLKIDEARLTLDSSDALALALGYIHLNSRKI